jgi:hypothetical protein
MGFIVEREALWKILFRVLQYSIAAHYFATFLMSRLSFAVEDVGSFTPSIRKKYTNVDMRLASMRF